VYIDAEVNTSPPLPANLEGQIRAQGLLSAGTMVSLEMPQSQTAAASVPQGQLQARAILPARFVGLEVVPREYAELAEELRKTSREFRDSGLVGHLDETVRATKLQIEKVGKVLDSVAELVEDKKIREDLRTSLANISRASETTTRISANLEKLSVEATGTVSKAQGHMDDLAKQLGARMEQLSKVLESFQSIAGKIDQGKGTAGLLVNDTRLYEGLVDTTRQLKLTIGDMRRLLEQWEQEGVTLRIQK
jgi:ABC-type transporter Mla subunit MlaD